jgi:hypothetical protein
VPNVWDLSGFAIGKHYEIFLILWAGYTFRERCNLFFDEFQMRLFL